MSTLTNITKSSEEIQFVSEAGDTYLVGTSESETLVAKNEDALTNINKN